MSASKAEEIKNALEKLERDYSQCNCGGNDHYECDKAQSLGNYIYYKWAELGIDKFFNTKTINLQFSSKEFYSRDEKIQSELFSKLEKELELSLTPVDILFILAESIDAYQDQLLIILSDNRSLYRIKLVCDVGSWDNCPHFYIHWEDGVCQVTKQEKIVFEYNKV